MKTTLPGASQVSHGECEASPTLNSGNTLIKGCGIRFYFFFHINASISNIIPSQPVMICWSYEPLVSLREAYLYSEGKTHRKSSFNIITNTIAFYMLR